MKKHIWILNHYAGGMYFDRGGRHYNFAKYFKQAGYEPVVFCANSKHGPGGVWFQEEELWRKHMAEEIGVPFVFVKARSYTGNGKQRVFNMMDFYRNVKKAAKEYAEKRGKPDIIYASSVHPLTLLAGLQLAKRFGVECVCEVRDLWPESIVEYSSRFTRNHPVIKLLYQGEKWIYKKADWLVFTMEGGGEYIRERGWEKAVPLSKVYSINNGVDLEAFEANREQFTVEDPDLDNPELFKVVYTGSIRRVNNLGLILDVARKVTDPHIKFLIWGDGDELPALRHRVEEEQIPNVCFKGQVEKKYVPSIISRADYTYINGRDNDFFRFGISMNKLFEYLAAGKPVLMCMRASYNPVERYGCGLICESTQALQTRLESLPDRSSPEYATMCENARRVAGDYDFQNLTRKLIDVIES